MDVKLSSDAIDISFHPNDSNHLLATGLISGKVQLIDYAALHEKTVNGDRDQASSTSRKKTRHEKPYEGDSDEEGEVGEKDKDEEGREQHFLKSRCKNDKKVWTSRPSQKSCRGVEFDRGGDSIWSLSKDGSIFNLDTETGQSIHHWQNAHEAAPSRLLPIQQNLVATGDDDGVVALWDRRRPFETSSSIKSSSSAIRVYTHHFDWITDFLWCENLIPPRTAKVSEEQERKKKVKEEKRQRKKNRKRGRTAKDEDDNEGSQSREAIPQRERLVCSR